MVEGLLEAYKWDAYTQTKKSEIFQNLGVWSEIPYLGILGQKQLICHNLSVQQYLRVIEGLLEAYRWGATN